MWNRCFVVLNVSSILLTAATQSWNWLRTVLVFFWSKQKMWENRGNYFRRRKIFYPPDYLYPPYLKCYYGIFLWIIIETFCSNNNFQEFERILNFHRRLTEKSNYHSLLQRFLSVSLKYVNICPSFSTKLYVNRTARL